MYDETPDYFIRDGKIYAHHEGSTYYSSGFREHEPSYNSELCEATPININKFLKNHNYLYNYDEGRKQTSIESKYKDAYENDIFIGSHVIFMDCDYTGTFLGYVKGIVEGFTKEYVYIRPIKYDKINRWHEDIPVFKRMPHRVICIENL